MRVALRSAFTAFAALLFVAGPGASTLAQTAEPTAGQLAVTISDSTGARVAGAWSR